MTDDDKALVERLFAMADEYDSGHHESWPTIDALEIAAHRIEALSAENERLREALRDVLVYAPDFMHGMPKKHYEKIANGSSDD